RYAKLEERRQALLQQRQQRHALLLQRQQERQAQLLQMRQEPQARLLQNRHQRQSRFTQPFQQTTAVQADSDPLLRHQKQNRMSVPSPTRQAAVTQIAPLAGVGLSGSWLAANLGAARPS